MDTTPAKSLLQESQDLDRQMREGIGRAADQQGWTVADWRMNAEDVSGPSVSWDVRATVTFCDADERQVVIAGAFAMVIATLAALSEATNGQEASD